ncbi:MAG TPA: hypothetical protein VH877_27250 [Polyangia bacterium]|nr:hypothetical protein [Polyangia bacterium]
MGRPRGIVELPCASGEWQAESGARRCPTPRRQRRGGRDGDSEPQALSMQRPPRQA